MPWFLGLLRIHDLYVSVFNQSLRRYYCSLSKKKDKIIQPRTHIIPKTNEYHYQSCFTSFEEEIVLFVCPTWKGICFTVFFSFFFFAHIRTHITKKTLWIFNGGNPWWRFHLWWIRTWCWLQFSHLQIYLLLWHMQMVNPQSRTESCKRVDCSHSSAWYILCIVIM